MSPEATPLSSSLRGRVMRGIGWMMASQGSTQILAFITSIAIARLLSPRQVGLATEALVFATLTLVISDFGLGAAIVQRPQLTERDISTAFWTSMGLGVVLTAMGIGLSWPIADLYGHPEVQPLFAALSFVFLFTSPGIVQGALLTRELDFRSLELRTIVATFTSCAVSITLAALGFGPWALIAQSLVISGLSTVLLYRSSPWRPHFVFSIESLRGMAQFAWHTFGANALSWAQLNCDNLLVGRFLGAAPLGSYSIATSASLSPLNRVAAPITHVFFPAFSRIQEPERIRVVWLRAMRMIAVIVVPTTLGLVVIGQEFVIGLFGHRWHAAVTPLELMAPIGLLQALAALSGGILASTGQTKLLWRSAALISGISVAAFAAGLPWGIDGVAAVYLGASLVVQPVYIHVTARTMGLTLIDVVRSLSGLLQAGITMMAVVYLVRLGLLDAGVPVLARLVILVLVGALAYVPLVAWRAPEIRAEIEDGLRRRGGESPTPGEGDPGTPALGLIRLVPIDDGAGIGVALAEVAARAGEPGPVQRADAAV